jgi:hypothetical protein
LLMKQICPEDLEQQKEFASRLALMHVEAGQLGLYVTMHKIHEAVKQVGYEMAGEPGLYDKIEEARNKRRPVQRKDGSGPIKEL